MLTPLKRYADFDGRASRSEYWLFQLLLALLTIPFNALMTFALYDDSTGLTLAFAVLALLLAFILLLLVFMLLPGTRGENRFGPPVLHL